jgi:hypothetical protein
VDEDRRRFMLTTNGERYERLVSELTG